MFEINVTVNAPELAEALNNLAAALKGAKPEPAASKTGKADKPAPVPPADYMPPADTAPAPAAPAPAVTPAPTPTPISLFVVSFSRTLFILLPATASSPELIICIP